MEGDHEDLSKEKLREHLFSALLCSGILDSVKTDCPWRPQRSSSVEEGSNHVSQLRARLLDQLRDRDGDGVVIETKNKSNKPSLTERLLSSLFLDYLGAYGYTFTLSVFLPESQMVAWPPFSYQDMLQLLHLDTSSALHHRLRIAPQGKGCLAQQLVMVLQQMPFRSNTQESSTQTEENVEVDEPHRHKEAQHMLPFYSIEDCINILHQEFDARVHAEVAMQVSNVRELEVSSVRLEEAARYRRQLARDREELEEIHKLGLDQKQAHEESLLERLFIKEKAMEASANEQREKVMADVNRLQDREEKLRRIKDMQERREEKLDQRELLLKANAEEVARVRETLSIQAHDTLALRRKELEEQYKGLHVQLQADRALIEDERVQMKVDRVAMAIELASARSDKELMQALHHRLSAEEDQRLALINTIRDLEHRLHRYKLDNPASGHGTSTNEMPTHCGRLEAEKLQGVVLAAEHKGFEWQLSQREVQRLQQKLQLKGNELEGYRHRQAQWVAKHKKLMAAIHQHEAALRDAELKLEMTLEEKDEWSFKHKKLLLTINQFETATKNAMDEKDNTQRRLESLRVQLRASESELLETVTLLKKTQQALEVERLQHYSLRSRTNSFLSLYRFNCASTSPGQQDGLHGDCKGQSDGCFKAMSLAEGWDPLKYLDEVPMPGPKIVVTDESGSRPKIFQNQQTTELRQEANDILSQINFNEDSDICFSEETSSLSTRFPNSSVPASNAHMFGVHGSMRADYGEHKKEMTHAVFIEETLDGPYSTFRQSTKEFEADLSSIPLQDDIESVHSLKDTPSCRKGGGRKFNLLESVFVSAAQYSSSYQPQKGKVKKLRSTRQNPVPQHSSTTSMSTASDSENSSTSGGRSLLHPADTMTAKEASVDQSIQPNFASNRVNYYEQNLKSTNFEKHKTQVLIKAQRSSTKGLLTKNWGTSEFHACCLSESEITREETRGRGGKSPAKSSIIAQVTDNFRPADWISRTCDLSTEMNEVTVTTEQGEAQECIRTNASSTNGLPSKPSWPQELYMGAPSASEDSREETRGSIVVSPLQSSSEPQMTSTCDLEEWSSRHLKPDSSCKSFSCDSDTQTNRTNEVTATGGQGEVREAPMMLKQSLSRNTLLTETTCTKGTFLCCPSASDDTSTREDSGGIDACIFDSACCCESEEMAKPDIRTGTPEKVLPEKIVLTRNGKDQKRAVSSTPGSWKETSSASAKDFISECKQTDDGEFQSELSSKIKSSEVEKNPSKGFLETQLGRDGPTLTSPSKPYTVTNQRLEKPQLSEYKKGFLEVGRQRTGVSISQESISEYKQKKTDAQTKPSMNATLASPKIYPGRKRVQFGLQQGESVQEVHIAGFGKHKEVEGLTAIQALHFSEESSNLEVFKQFIQGTSNPSPTYGDWSDDKHGGPEKDVAHEPAGCKEVGDGAVTRRVFSSQPEEESISQKEILKVTEAIQVSSKGQAVLVANVRAHEQHFVESLAQCEKLTEEEKSEEFTCSLKEEGKKLVPHRSQGVSGSTASCMREAPVRVQGAQEQRISGKALRHGESEMFSALKEEAVEEAAQRVRHNMASSKSVLASTFSEQGGEEPGHRSARALRHAELEEIAVVTNVTVQNWKDTLQTTHSVSEGSAINVCQAIQTVENRSQKDILGSKTGRREKIGYEVVNRNLFSSQIDKGLDSIQLSPAKSAEGGGGLGRVYTPEQKCVVENFRHETHEKEEIEHDLCRDCTQVKVIEVSMQTLPAQSDESASFTNSFTEKCARHEISEDAEMVTEPLSPGNKNTMVVTPQGSNGDIIWSITKKSAGGHVLKKVGDVSMETLRPQSNNKVCSTPKLTVTEQGARHDTFELEKTGREPLNSRHSKTPVVASRCTNTTAGITPTGQNLDGQVSGYEKLGSEDANRDWITLQRKQEMEVLERGFNEGLTSMIRAPSQQFRELIETETAAGESERHTKENTEDGTALSVTDSWHGSEEEVAPTKTYLKSSTKEETRVNPRPSPSTLSITNITGGPMRELSELLSMHEASLRERFKHSKAAETNKRIGLSEGGMPTHSKGFREKEDPGEEARAKSEESVTRDCEGRVFEAFQTRALMELSETGKQSAGEELRSRETVSYEGQLAAECKPASQLGVKEEEKVNPSWSSARVKLERKSTPWLSNWTAEKLNPRLSSSCGDPGSEKAFAPENQKDFDNEESSSSGASFVNDEKGEDKGKSVTEHVECRREVLNKMNRVRICSGSSSLLINFDQKILAKEDETSISEESCCDCILRAPSVRTSSLVTPDGLERTSPPSPTVTDGQEPAGECSVNSEQGSHSPAEDAAGEATSWLDECRLGLNAEEPLDYNDILGSPRIKTSETNGEHLPPSAGQPTSW